MKKSTHLFILFFGVNELEFDQVIKDHLINSINNSSNCIQESCKISKYHIRQVNPSVNQTEEAYKRITKFKNNTKENVARILFNMHYNNAETSKIMQSNQYNTILPCQTK